MTATGQFSRGRRQWVGLFMAWPLLLFLRSVQRVDPLGLCNTVILVTVVQVFCYGIRRPD